MKTFIPASFLAASISLHLVRLTNSQQTQGCVDIPPPDSHYSCSQQRDWGKCNDPFMLAASASTASYCASTCGRCQQSPISANFDGNSTGITVNALVSGPQPNACACYDAPAISNSSCAEQAALGQCRASWMLTPSPYDKNGHCTISCQACSPNCLKVTAPVCPCSDVQPAILGLNCAQVVDKGMCDDSTILGANEDSQYGYCMASCSRCPCSDIPPPEPNNTYAYTCPEQAFFNKCSESWMTAITPAAPSGYCQISCGRCDLAQECPEFYLASGVTANSSSQTCPSDTCPAPPTTSMESVTPLPPTPAGPYVQYSLPQPGTFSRGRFG